MSKEGIKLIANNKKAYHDYFVDEAVKTNAQGYKMFPVDLGVTFTYIIK